MLYSRNAYAAAWCGAATPSPRSHDCHSNSQRARASARLRVLKDAHATETTSGGNRHPSYSIFMMFPGSPVRDFRVVRGRSGGFLLASQNGAADTRWRCMRVPRRPERKPSGQKCVFVMMRSPAPNPFGGQTTASTFASWRSYSSTSTKNIPASLIHHITCMKTYSSLYCMLRHLNIAAPQNRGVWVECSR